MDAKGMESLALALSWCEEEGELLGVPVRPLSLGSRHLLGLMRSRMLDLDPGYETEEGEMRDLTLYAWLHSAPLREVTDAMWSGAWRAVMESAQVDEATRREVLPEWRERRLRMASLCAAVDYQAMPKPRPGAADGARAQGPTPPADLMNPTRLAHRVWLLRRETGCDRREALWECPYWQAVQICHAAERYEGAWTVPPRVKVPVEEFEGFDLGEDEGGGAVDGER